MFARCTWIGLAAAVAVGTVFACARAGAAGRQWPMRRQGDFLIVDTPHFHIRTDHDPTIAHGVATHQELLYQELARRMGGGKPQSAMKRMPVILCTTEEKTREVARAKVPGATGLYEMDLSGWGTAEDIDALLATFRREGTQQCVHQFLDGRAPVWLVAGLSTYFQIAKYKGGRLVAGQAPLLLVQSLQKAAEEGRLLPVSKMVSMTVSDWNAAVKAKSAQSKVQSQQAWSIVHFLEQGEKGRFQKAFVQYMTLLGQGRTSQDAWARTFGTNMAAFGKSWLACLKALQATEQLDCRTNLRMVTAMAFYARGRPDIVGSIESLRDAALRGDFTGWTATQYGAEIKIEGAETFKKLFHCSQDKREGDPISYQLVRTKPDEPPIVRCLHHEGMILETQYRKDPEDEKKLTLMVVSRPAKPGEKEAAKAKDQAAEPK